MSSSASSSSSFWQQRRDFLIAYLIFGFLHELSHIATASYYLGYDYYNYDGNGNDKGIFSWILVLLGRACKIPSLETAEEWEIQLVRNAGWIASVIIAAIVTVVVLLLPPQVVVCHNKKHKHPKEEEESLLPKNLFQNAIWQAAIVTAIEGLTTDLLLFGTGFTSTKTTTFLCGNFGIILLNPSWTDTPGDYGKTALDLLQKMIQVTMMRGAQTGGVVTWVSGKGKGNTAAATAAPTAIRSRVVNGKRTDLSVEIRKLLNRDVCHNNKKLNPTIQFLMGHTRFATSSKATMEGTHPHQWSTPEKRRIYPLGDRKMWKSTSSSTTPKPVVQDVSNYITHNGDLDFFIVNGQHADLELVQNWLVQATGHPLPAAVDSVAIAGLVDIIRSAGCFALSIRYAHLIASETSTISLEGNFPTYGDYEKFGLFFESCLEEYLTTTTTTTSQGVCTMSDIKEDKTGTLRDGFCNLIYKSVVQKKKTLEKSLGTTAFQDYFNGLVESVSDEEKEFGIILSDIPMYDLIQKTVNAFFDNDLMETTKIFLSRAVGSFGIVVSSSMDARRQICIAARGQPMSIAFYPEKGVICYGSELAAVKAGMTFDNPGGNTTHRSSSRKLVDMTQETCRFDLDDLGGEVALVDFSSGDPTVKTFQEGKSAGTLRSRITPLEGNEFLLPLTADKDDPILDDLQSIPQTLHRIQDNWHKGGLNRMTAWHLGKKLGERLQGRAQGKYGDSLDILVTGCEVSLWLAEQFVSDLQKSFPKLRIRATSSNKLLGVFGQELAVPSIGHSMSSNIPDLKNSIVIIVSHSGGTFGPLAISNLLQSVTRNIFVVASEWDTQIGKQLRAMSKTDKADFLASRVFTTDIGVRPAEPCSLSVVATHQLLTQIFEYLCLIVLRDHVARDTAGAVVTYRDLQILEKCNQEVILGLERVVGRDINGEVDESAVQAELRAAGDLWADHVLECAKAYIMTIIYVMVTVTIGYPIVSGIATAAGLNADWAFYITRFLDGAIYVLLPQINVIILRLIEGRNLRHRMTGRTVVIGDVPWVAQASEAFLSKIFARSYSIAGLNVLSGNPSDHLVHRHTHRVTRGTLLACGRPDGRLTALTSAECAVNLSVNQASSIQSIGGTCESITIGHNPAKLGLTKNDITLNTTRPKFLCEQLLDSMDAKTTRMRRALSSRVGSSLEFGPKRGIIKTVVDIAMGGSQKSVDTDVESKSSASLKGAYLGLRAESSKHTLNSQRISMNSTHRPSAVSNGKRSVSMASTSTLEGMEFTTEEFEIKVDEMSKAQMILHEMLDKNQKSKDMKEIFLSIDQDRSGVLDVNEFVLAYSRLNNGMSREEAVNIFNEADVDGSGTLTYEEFVGAMRMQHDDILRKLRHAEYHDEKGILNIQPSRERFFGADLYSRKENGIPQFAQEHSQHFSMELYESRIASMERFVAFCVMFHQLGKRVQDFFPKFSFGFMNYKMERTHSIMRIATTASPVSGDAVRDMMEILRLQAGFQNSAQLIQNTWRQSEKNRFEKLKRQDSERSLHSATSSSTAKMSDSERTRRSLLDNSDRTFPTYDHSYCSLLSVDMSGRPTKLDVVDETETDLLETEDLSETEDTSSEDDAFKKDLSGTEDTSETDVDKKDNMSGTDSPSDENDGSDEKEG